MVQQTLQKTKKGDFKSRFVVLVPNPMPLLSYYSVGTWFGAVQGGVLSVGMGYHTSMVQYKVYRAVWPGTTFHAFNFGHT